MSQRARWGSLILLLFLSGCMHGDLFAPRRHPEQVRAIQVQKLQASDLENLRELPQMTGPAELRKISVFFRGSVPMHKYEFLLGPDSQGHMSETTGCFILDYGWVYACGYMPCISSGGVSAGADGSCLIMCVDKATHLVRLFFIDGHYAWVDVTKGGKTVTTKWYDPNQYVEVPSGGDATKPLDLPSDKTDPIRVQHDDAQAQGAAALKCP